MKNCIRGLSFLIVLVSCLAGTAIAGTRPETAMGKSQYIRWNMPTTPESDVSDDVSGAIVLDGNVAEMMWNHMVNATFNPGAPDLEQRTPAQISRDACPSRIGANVICRKIPTFTKDGNGLVRDNEGKVVYYAQCDVVIDDVTTGKFMTHKR